MIFKIIRDFGTGINIALDVFVDGRYDDEDYDYDEPPELLLITISDEGLTNLEGVINEYPEIELVGNDKLNIIGVDII